MTTEEQKSESDKPSASEAVAKIKEMREKLARQEQLTGPSGAAPAASPRMLLDASDVQAMHPDKRVRWVNLKNEPKVLTRQAAGYERVPVAEGGRQIGNLALFAIPREQYEATLALNKKRNEERLSAHKKEVEGVAEQVSKLMRDQYGISVPTERLLISDKD